MFCKKCGKEIMDEAVVCPSCGCQTEKAVAKPAEADGKSFGFGVLGFFVPIVGLILYLMWKDTTPLKAKSAGKGALIGAIVSVVLAVVYYVIAMSVVSATLGALY